MKYIYLIIINVCVAVLYMASAIFVQIGLSKFVSQGALPYIYTLIMIAMGIIVLLCMNLLYKKQNETERYINAPLPKIDLLKTYQSKIDTSKLIIGIALSVFMVAFVAVFKYLATGNVTIDGEEFKILRGIFASPGFFLFYMLAPAVAEEIIFRACLLHMFVMKNRKKLGLIAIGAVFGAMHITSIILNKEEFTLHSLIWLSNVSLAGVLLGYIYIRYGLLIAMFFHWFWNASWYRTMGTMEKSVFFIIGMVLVILISEVLLRRLHKKRN